MAKIIKEVRRYWWILFIVGLFLVYSYGLGKVPIHLNQDELEFALNAKSIADTGRDLSGKVFPFYFWHLNGFWATPVIVYVTAFVLKFAPLAESTIRLSSVIIGVSSIALIMLLVQKIFKEKKLTMISGMLAATTPVLFIHSRVLLDNLYPVPFVLLWLLFLYLFKKSKRTSFLFWSGLALGVGLHSYHAAKIYMPMYFVATVAYLIWEKKGNWQRLGSLLIGFLIPVVLFIPWLTKYPDTLLNQVSYIGSIDKSVDVEKGLLGVFNVARLKQVTDSYGTYFGSRILFTEGDRSLIHSTHKTGAFLFPVSIFLILGIANVISNKKDKYPWILLFGLATYPLAPSIVNDPQRISRGLIIIPFVLLLSVYGVKFMISSKEKLLKSLAVILLIIIPLQFAFFVKDYFEAYPVRSYHWFNNDIGGALESAINNTTMREVDTIYIDESIWFIDKYWDFYQKKFSKELTNKTIFFNHAKQKFTGFPKGSLVVIQSDHVPKGAPQWVGNFEKVEIIREPGGNESFYVYYQNR